MKNSNDEHKYIDRLIADLGWPRSKRKVKRFSDRDDIVWYESSLESGAILQINTLPNHRMGVYVMDRGIFTGFHEAVIHCDESSISAEADRLRTYLSSAWYRNTTSIEGLLKQYPQFGGWTPERLQTCEEPAV